MKTFKLKLSEWESPRQLYQFGEKKRRESDSAEQNSGRSTWPEKELINRLTKRERERERIRESVGTWCGKEKGNWKNRRRSQGRRRRARGERERGHGRGERKGENRGFCRWRTAPPLSRRWETTSSWKDATRIGFYAGRGWDHACNAWQQCNTHGFSIPNSYSSPNAFVTVNLRAFQILSTLLVIH